MNALRGLRRLVCEHPLISIWFGIGFVGLAVWIGVSEPWTWLYGAAIWLLVLWWAVYKKLSKLLAVVLALSISIEGRPQQTAPVVAGVVVLVFGTVVVISLTKFCKKAYSKPKPTNSVEELSLSLADNPDYGASDLWFSEYCYDLQDLSLVYAGGPETVIIGTVGQTLSLAVDTDLCDRDEYRAVMEAQGLPLEFGRQYAAGGLKAYQWDTPILFGQPGGTVPHVTISGDKLRTTVVERSFDLVSWWPILTNTMPVGMQLRWIDNTTEGAAFYRVR
jgi:hypothetical protein